MDDLNEEQREALNVLQNARPGDLVLWADRSVAMEVEKTGVDDDGNNWIDVNKPRGDGVYRVRERYQSGRPKFTSPIGRANNLHFVDRAPEPRGLSEADYRELVQRSVENATDSFVRLNYEGWAEAVEDVAEAWADEVAFQDWPAYRHHPEWEEGDVEAIFESAVEHSTFEAVDDENPIRMQAENALYSDIFDEGRQQAEESLITNQREYTEFVEMKAQHVLDRFDRKSYSSARHATRDTVSAWIDDRQRPAFQSVIEYGNTRFEDDYYDNVDDPIRERAFDILDHDIWEVVQEMQRERGEHDPTLRGLTYTDYQDLLDQLAKRVVRSYDGTGFIRNEAKRIVEMWADEVEAREWDGHRHRVYAAGDVEDIFSSAAIHAEADPFVFNPFSSDIERKTAILAVAPDVVKRAKNLLDEREQAGEAVPADEYIQDYLGMDATYDEFASAHPEDTREVMQRVMDSVEGDEVGWTFVDEILEMDGVVPEATNDWVLVDYGVIREGEKIRKLAWFDRDDGDILVLSGMANAEPMDMQSVEEPFDTFHVALHQYGEDTPEFLLREADLEDALNYVYDYVESDMADLTIIEDQGETYVLDQLTQDDINAGGVLDSLVPNISWGTEDMFTLADTKVRSLGKFVSDWGAEISRLTAYVVIAWGPKWAGDRLDGVRVEPIVSKKHGLGTRISKNFGAAPHESGVGGQSEIKLNVRPSTFSNLGERYAPKFLQYGFDEGDLGKGAVKQSSQAISRVRQNDWGRAFLDEFGGSITKLDEFIKSSAKSSDDSDSDSFTWQDFEDSDLGISGMMMRGLDAEALVSSAEFFNIDSWLNDHATFYPSDYVDSDDIPTFEEWEQEMYGAGEAGGPEEESRRLARYHREVAGNAEGPEPYDYFDVGEDVMEEMERQTDEVADTDPDGRAATGDYDLSDNEQHIDMTFEDMEDIPESLDASPEDGDGTFQTESDAD